MGWLMLAFVHLEKWTLDVVFVVLDYFGIVPELNENKVLHLYA